MRRRVLPALFVLPLLAACATQPAPQPVRVVFFTQDSAALDGAAQGVIKEAAAAALAAPTAPVTVRGFAGPAGSAGYNQALSDARAQMVADSLRNAGVPPSRLRVVPRGPVQYQDIPTEARRVEIAIGG